jgi:hypothetical protein
MGSERRVRGLSAVVGVMMWTCSAAAQERAIPEPTPHPFGRLQVGALAITPVLQVTNVGIDTNVFDLSGTERQSPDLTATVVPGVEARFVTRRLDARVVTRAALVFYRRYAAERAVNPMVEFSADERLTARVALYGKGSVGYAKSRTGFEIDTRPRSLSHGTTVGTRLGGRKLELDLHGSYADISYDPSARFLNISLHQTLNHSSRGGGAGLAYRLSPYTTLKTTGDLVADRFEFSPDRDSNAVRASVGFEFHPRAIISGRAAIGYIVVDSLSDRTPGFSGLTPSAGLTYTLRDMLTVGVGGERGVENSFHGDRPYFVYTLYEASIRQALFHHLDVGGSLQYTTLKYQRFNDVSQAAPLPVDRLRMVTLNVGVPVARKIRVGLYVQRWQRVSGQSPYRTLRAGLEMTVGRLNISPRGVFLSGPAR